MWLFKPDIIYVMLEYWIYTNWFIFETETNAALSLL